MASVVTTILYESTPEPLSLKPGHVKVSCKPTPEAPSTPLMGAVLSRRIDAVAGAALTAPAAFFHQARTVLVPSHDERTKFIVAAADTQFVHEVASLRQTCVATPEVTARAALTVVDLVNFAPAASTTVPVGPGPAG